MKGAHQKMLAEKKRARHAMLRMRREDPKRWTMEALASRYGVTYQAIQQQLRKAEQEENKEGVHL